MNSGPAAHMAFCRNEIELAVTLRACSSFGLCLFPLYLTSFCGSLAPIICLHLHDALFLLATLALAAVVGAADNAVQYILATATITQCASLEVLTRTVDIDLLGPTCIIKYPEIFGGPIIVEVEAPECDCGCKTCINTIEYTTYFPAFCSTGLYEQKYVITETYKGMEVQPTIESQSIPFGFTCDMQTCTTCGPEPITATITYPVNGHPYINGGARPTLMPAKPGEISAESGGPSGGQAGSNDGSRSGQNGEKNGTNGGSHSSSESGQNGSHNGIQTGDSGSNSGSNSGGNSSSNSGINGDSNGGSQSGQNGGQDAKSDKGNAEPEITRTDDGFESSVKPTSGTDTSETVSPGTSNVPVAVSGAGRELGLTGLGMALLAVIPLMFL
ncbi:hypothetical protein FCOIX_8234 [Fusarium coicis]|nr:hypothetical protein FCOIX_8234 [Fusarium coicis]